MLSNPCKVKIARVKLNENPTIDSSDHINRKNNNENH
jgi:hypothetical protein